MTFKTIALLSILPIVALFWLGCGVDEEPIRPRAAQGEDAGPDLENMSLEERIEVTDDQDEIAVGFFTWPAGQPGERDGLADARSCRLEALENEDYVRSNGLVRVSMLTSCMNEKGWLLDKAAVRAHEASR